MIKYLLVFCFSLATALFLTPLIRKFSLWKRLVDKRDYRKAHRKIVTRLGGIGIYLAFTLAMVLSFFLDRQFQMKEFFGSFVGLIIGGTVILALGIYDDIKGAGAWKKFSLQIVAAIIIILFGFKIAVITSPFSGTIELGFLAIPITIIWIVGITNAINIIDGVDGLAAGMVAIVSLTLFVVALPQGHIPLVFMSIALAGATLGFLKYNFSPAKIFMGDTGSMFLGFILAAMSIAGNRKSTVAVAILIPIIVLGIPIMDTFLAIIRRLLKGVHVFRADNEHIHHRLLHLGLSHKQVTLTLYFITILLGLVAFAFTLLNDRWTAFILVVMAVIIVLTVRRLRLVQFSFARQVVKPRAGKLNGKTAGIHLSIPNLKKGLKAGTWVFFLVVILFLFKTWNSSFDRIENILDHPEVYKQKNVKVVGRIVNSFALPFVGSIYKIDDGTGTIWVLSEVDYPPKNWFLYLEAGIKSELKVDGKGVIDTKTWSKLVGVLPLGPVLCESKRTSVWSSFSCFGRQIVSSLSTNRKVSLGKGKDGKEISPEEKVFGYKEAAIE